MAVTPKKTSVYRAFKHRMFLLLLGLQALLILGGLLLLWPFQIHISTTVLTFIAVLFGLSALTFAVVSYYIAQTVRDIEDFAQDVINSVATDGLPSPPKRMKTNIVGPEMAVVMQNIYEVTSHSQREKFSLTSQGVSMQGLFKDLPAGCVIFNEKAELSIINPFACELLGIPAESPTTRAVLELIKSLQANGTPLNFVDWLHETRSNQIQALKRWSGVTLKRENDEGQTVTVAFDMVANYRKRDVKSYELVLLLIDRSDEFDRQEKQMEFISLAAHELRGPITVMRGLIDIMQQETNDKLNGEDKEMMTRMSVSARQLAGYVDNILGASRIDRDSFEVSPTKVDWADLLRQVSQDLIVRATAHHRILKFDIPKKLPAAGVDPVAIQHVVNNLIDNAIKYSKDGGEIIVSVKVKNQVLETTVQDFGIGIPSSVVDNLFTKFYRSHRSKQTVSGTGLGLYLSKAIVEAHGGNIWVRSSENVGTTFGFTVPTYESVADQLKKSNNETSGIIRGRHGWIKNHALYRR